MQSAPIRTSEGTRGGSSGQDFSKPRGQRRIVPWKVYGLKDVTYLPRRGIRILCRLRLAPYRWELQLHAARIDAMVFGLHDGQDGVHGLLDLRIRVQHYVIENFQVLELLFGRLKSEL